MAVPLELGWHTVALQCPDCGDTLTAPVELLTVRSRVTGEGVTLRLKAKAAKIAHSCGQGRLELGGLEVVRSDG